MSPNANVISAVAVVISALAPFGLAGLTIGAIALLALRRNLQTWLLAGAMVLIALIFGADKYFIDTYWFRTGIRANWDGGDIAFTKGEFPKYKSKGGAALCDAGHVGNVVTCWDQRAATASDVPPISTADSDVDYGTQRWCAYKSGAIGLNNSQTGRAQPGVVYVCGQAQKQ